MTESNTQPSNAKEETNKQRELPLKNLIVLGLAAAFVFSSFGSFPIDNYYLDLSRHFRLQYFFFALVLLPLLYWYRCYRLAMVALFCVGINATFILPWYLPFTKAENLSQKELVLLLANVQTQNREYQQLITLVESQAPDIIILQEVDKQWQSGLSELTDRYSYNYIVPRPDNFGIALMSKLPLQDIKEVDWGNLNLPSLVAKFYFQKQMITLFATHPLPPINKQYSQLRDTQLLAMMQQVANTRGPKIVMGDLNLTMWSKSYQILDSPFLTNARFGFGVMASWPSKLIPFGIPIDHALVSKHWHVEDFQIESSINSDHRPLVVKLKLKN